MAIGIKCSVDVKNALARLNGLKFGRRNTILRTAATKASRLVAKTAKSKVKTQQSDATEGGRKRTKQLWRSIGFVVRQYQKHTLGVIGPRHGFAVKIGTHGKEKRNKKGKIVYRVGDDKIHDPAKIAHLVELGHGGPKPAPAYPFMRPAYDQNKSAIQQIYADEVSKGMAKLAAKGVV